MIFNSKKLVVFCFLLPMLVEAAPKAVKAPKPLQLVLSLQPGPSFGGFYAADPKAGLKKGQVPKRTENTFEKVLGRPLKMLPAGSRTPASQMVASGVAEFGIASSGEIVTGMTKGADLVPLFAIFQTNPLVYIAHAKWGFQSFYDLVDSEKMILATTLGFPGLMRFQKNYKKERNKEIRATLVPTREGISHFLSSENHAQQGYLHTDLVLVNEAIAKKNEENKKLGLPLEEPAVYFPMPLGDYRPYIAVLVTRKAFLDENRELVSKMVQVVRAGWIDYFKNPQEVNERMHVLNPSLAVATMNAGTKLEKELIQPVGLPDNQIGMMTKERWLNIATELAVAGVIQVPSVAMNTQSEEEWRKALAKALDPDIHKMCQGFCL